MTTGAPRVSVVVTCRAGGRSLRAALQSVLDQVPEPPGEILVVAPLDLDLRNILGPLWRTPVRLVQVAGRPSLPALRRAGIRSARGRAVALLGEHGLAPADWLARALAAQDDGHPLVGGVVENAATTRLVDWARYFNEYARHMPPVPAGPTPDIPLGGAVFARHLFDALGVELERDAWEGSWYARLAVAGVRPWRDPELRLVQTASLGLLPTLAQRRDLSRSHAAMRLQGAPFGKRLVHALASPALLAILPWRTLRQVWRTGRRRGTLLASLPLLGLLALAAAWGEAAGALAGPGDSTARVE